MSPNYLGLILAGGQSQRMGQDKAFLPFGKTSLFDYVLHRFSCQINHIVISTASQHPTFIGCGHELIHDLVPFAQLGPLSGLYAAFNYCKQLEPKHHYDGIITIAIDTPFFPDNYVLCLCSAAAVKPHYALIAATEHRQHPTFSLWPLEYANILKSHLEKGNRSLLSFATQIKAETVIFPSPGNQDPFFNINTPQERDLALKRLAMLEVNHGKGSG